jgi:hypothetical protein
MPFFALWAHKDAGMGIEYIGLLLGCYAVGERRRHIACRRARPGRGRAAA